MRWHVTLLFLFACVSPLIGQTPTEKKHSLAYLASLQTKEGGFRADTSAKEPTLRGTSASLRAIKYFGGKPSHVAECKAFVKSCHDEKSGGFANTPGAEPDVVLTAVGLMAIVELGIPTEPYEKSAIAYLATNAKTVEEIRMAAAGLEAISKRSDKNAIWIDQLTKKQNPDGTFGKAEALPRDTGGAVACLLRLGGKVKEPKAVTTALDEGQNADGGWCRAKGKGSDLETTYRIMRTYQMLKSKPSKANELRRFVAKCRNKDGGYGVTPGATSSTGGTYFASILLHWLDQE